MEGCSRMLLLLLTIDYVSTVPTPLDQLTLNFNIKDGHSHQERGLLNDYGIANVNGNDNEGNDNANTNEGNFNGNSNIGNKNGIEHFGNDNGNDNLGNVNGNDNWGESNGNLNEGNDNGNENEGNGNGKANEGNVNGNKNLGNYTGNENLDNHMESGKGYGFKHRKDDGGKYGRGSLKNKYGGYGKKNWGGKYGGHGKGYGGWYGKGYTEQTKSTKNCQCGKVNKIPVVKYDPTLNYKECKENQESHMRASQEISGGGYAKANQYPFMTFVAIRKWVKRGTITRKTYGTCGGSLISNKHIITASHCIPPNEDLLIKGSYVRLGAHVIVSIKSRPKKKGNKLPKKQKKLDKEEKYSIKDVKYPAGKRCIKKVWQCDHDIAIIVLKDTVEFTKKITPICLPQPNEKIDHKLKTITIGWGNICNQDEPPVIKSIELKQVQVELSDVNNFEIWRVRKALPNVTNFLLAYDQVIGGKRQGTGIGDSGGPLFQYIKVTDRSYYSKLIGLTSRTFPVGDGKFAMAYVAINPFLKWIKQTVASEPGSFICKPRI